MNYKKQKLLTIISLLIIFIIILAGIEGENIKIKAQSDLEFVTPVSNYKANIQYGQNFANYLGFYKGKNYYGFHSAEDIPVVAGTPVYAITNGTVVKISDLNSLGELIAIRHDEKTYDIPGRSETIEGESYKYLSEKVDKIYSVYVHVDPIKNESDWVKKGEKIGEISDISSAGLGSHLHFEIRHPDQITNGKWTMVGDISNWCKFNDDRYNGYYKNLQKMVDAGIRHPSDFLGVDITSTAEKPAPSELIRPGTETKSAPTINNFKPNLEINTENFPSVLQREKTIEFNLNVTNTSELKFEDDLSFKVFTRRVKDSNTYASYEIKKGGTNIDKGEQKSFEIELKMDSELPLEKPVEKYQLSIALVNKKEILDSILIDFDLFKGPYIEKIEPLYAGVGDEVKIIGKNFPTDEEFWVDISIPGLTGEILSKSSNEIKFIVPEPNFVLETKEDRQRKVFLRERTVINPWRSNEVHFVFARPHINFIHPEKGTPESKIEIVGKHFGGINEPEVRFGETVLEARDSPPVPLGKSGKVISWQEDKLIVSPPKDYGTGISAIEDAYSLINAVMEGPSEFIEGEAKEKYYKKIFELLDIENLEIDIEKVSYLELFRKMALAMSIPGLDLQTTGEIDVPVVIKTKMGKSNSIIFHYINILNPAVAVVMDVSGSMDSHSKLGSAKKAINSFIDSQNEDYYVSLAAYSTNAKSVVNPVSIAGGEEELRKGITFLSAAGNTNIGSGLTVGLNQLYSLNNSQKNSRMILLSDGKNNTGELWPVVKECSKKGIKVDTVAFGSDADYDTLYKISKMTGGRALKAGNKNLSYIYHRISNQIQNYSTLFASKDFMKPGQELNYLVNVDSGIETLKFYTNWQGSKILMEFTDPDGNKITPDKNSAKYTAGETYNIYEIEAKPGQWEMSIIGRDLPAQGEQVNVSVSGKSSFYTNFLTFQPEYSAGSEVMIGIEVDKVKGLSRIPLNNVQVKAEIHKPSVAIAKKSGNKIEVSLGGLFKAATQKKEVEITLHDDGNHYDYRKSDGIFANVFSETDEKGPYLVTGVIEGELEDGQKIKRQIFETFQVGPIDENELTTSQMTEEIFKSFIPFE